MIKVPEIPKYVKSYPQTTSLLLVGKPGIGKSEAIIKFAKDEAKEKELNFIEYDELTINKIDYDNTYLFIDLRLTEVEPADLVGIPQANNGFMTYKPLRWAAELTKCKAGLLFLDELTNVQRQDVIAAAYKIVNERKIGYIKLHDNIRIIAAGNSPEHSAIARELPAPLINRFAVLETNESSVSEWIEWAVNNLPEFDKRVAGYLMNMQSDFIQVPKNAETLEPYPTPRSWARLAITLVNINDEDMIQNIADSYVGKAVGSRFVKFLTLDIADIEELVKNPDIFRQYDTDKRWLSVTMAASNYVQKPSDKFKELIKTIAITSQEMLYVFIKLVKANDKAAAYLKNILINDPEIRKYITLYYSLVEQYL